MSNFSFAQFFQEPVYIDQPNPGVDGNQHTGVDGNQHTGVDGNQHHSLGLKYRNRSLVQLVSLLWCSHLDSVPAATAPFATL